MSFFRDKLYVLFLVYCDMSSGLVVLCDWLFVLVCVAINVYIVCLCV